MVAGPADLASVPAAALGESITERKEKRMSGEYRAGRLEGPRRRKGEMPRWLLVAIVVAGNLVLLGFGVYVLLVERAPGTRPDGQSTAQGRPGTPLQPPSPEHRVGETIKFGDLEITIPKWASGRGVIDAADGRE